MDINKDKIQNLVSVFYRNTFKIFYINSCDGENFVKPFGVFVSLGITTSMKTLNDIKDIIRSNGYNACLAEISSKKSSGQYLNTLSTVDGIKQYDSEVCEDENYMDKKKAESRLLELRSQITSEQDLQLLKELVPKISHLEDIINKLNSNFGWDTHQIKESGNNYQLYHKLVNYKKEGEIEYRIGIYVSENSN